MEQQIVNIFLGSLISALGWIIKIFWQSNKELEKQLGEHKLFAANNYLKIERFERLVKELFDKIDKVSDKIDNTFDTLDSKIDVKGQR
jgi:hypothetical protein